MNFDLVIFDCDGVVVDTETTALTVLRHMISEKNLPIENTNAFVEMHRGKKIASILDEVSKQYHIQFPENFIDDFRKRSFEVFEKEITPIDGIEEVLKSLKVPFCMGSNSPLALIESCLALTNLLQYFEGKIYSAYELNRWKPDPFLFQFAADAMGVSHERCLVVEDSLCGVQAAVSAKMFPLGYVDGLEDDAKTKERSEILQKEGATVISDMRNVLNWV